MFVKLFQILIFVVYKIQNMSSRKISDKKLILFEF